MKQEELDFVHLQLQIDGAGVGFASSRGFI